MNKLYFQIKKKENSKKNPDTGRLSDKYRVAPWCALLLGKQPVSF